MATVSVEIPDWIPAWLQYALSPDPEKYVPYAGHIKPNVVKLFDRSVLAMLHLHGQPFELAPDDHRNARAEQVNTLLRQLADADLTVDFHLVRHETVSPPPQPVMPEGFPRDFARDYERVALRGMFRNDWFISPSVRPPVVQRATNYLGVFRKPSPTALAATNPRQSQHLEDTVRLISSTLAEYAPTRLSMKPVSVETGQKFRATEMGSALHLIRTAEYRTIPDTTGALAAAIYATPPFFGPLAFDLGPGYRRRYGAIIGFANYPGRAFTGMFSALLSAPYPLVMTHRFQFLSASVVARAFDLLQRQMKTAGDHAKTLEEGIGDAANRTASQLSIAGAHHFSLAVYADNLTTLDGHVSDAMKRISDFGGAGPTREMNVWWNGAMEQSYHLQMPGSRLFRPRPGKIESPDVAAMVSLDNYPTGARTGYWGASPIRLRSNGGTAYDYIPDDEDVLHCLFVGPSGRGKTAAAGALLTSLGPTMGPDGIRIVVDKDDGNKLCVEANGGTHRRIHRNEPSGLAPLLLSDSPRRRAFLHQLYTWLIERDQRGKIRGDDDARMMRGIARQMKIPPEKRSMGGVREFMGFSSDGAGERFERYCRGGSMGWLLDNDEHLVHLGPGFFGFDLTDLIPKEGQADDGACETAGAVITHQISDFMDGRRIAAFFDEAKFYLRPLKSLIDDWTITGRKKSLMCWLAAQQPEHFTDSDIGMSLVAQARTKIVFPDANYSAANLAKLELSEPAIRLLKGAMTLGNSRRFLLWRPSGPVVCEFDLTGLPQLPILSGRPQTVSLMERIRKETPERSATEHVDEFLDRLRHMPKAA